MKFLILLFIIFFNFCTAPEPKKQVEVFPEDKYWNDLSHFLAGEEALSKDNQFYKISESKIYTSYSARISRSYNLIQTNYISKVKPWLKDNFKDSTSNTTVIYPLGGADFINLFHFYPNAKEYYMIGLEHPGNFTNPEKLNQQQLQTGFSAIEAMTSDMGYLNYFISKNMRANFSNPVFTGVAPMLVVFMTRLGLEVKYIEKVAINEEGKLVSILDYTQDFMNKKNVIEGMRIYFHSPEKNENKKLTFLRMYIGTNSQSINSKEGKFFNSLNRCNLILKSAEYLFHRPEYKDFANFLIEKSDMIVQDDTGIPYMYFNKKDWQLSLFGSYSQQFVLRGVYLHSDQPGLKELFKENSKPLPFTYGYGVLKGRDQSNLEIYIRNFER